MMYVQISSGYDINAVNHKSKWVRKHNHKCKLLLGICVPCHGRSVELA